MKELSITFLIAAIAFTVGYKCTSNEYAPATDRIPYTWEIQEQLRSAGYDIGDSGADGDIGPATKKAWKQYERDYTNKEVDEMFIGYMKEESK